MSLHRLKIFQEETMSRNQLCPMWGRFLRALLILPALAIFLPPHPVQAATYVVTEVDDSNGTGRLQRAINDANANPGPDTILFAGAAGAPGATIILGSALPTITEDLFIDASPVSNLTIDGNGRIFNVATGI